MVLGQCAVYLQYKVPVWSQLEVQVLVVQMFSEGQQELILPADVCSQDERAQLLFHVLPVEERGRYWAKPTESTNACTFCLLYLTTAAGNICGITNVDLLFSSKDLQCLWIVKTSTPLKIWKLSKKKVI